MKKIIFVLTMVMMMVIVTGKTASAETVLYSSNQMDQPEYDQTTTSIKIVVWDYNDFRSELSFNKTDVEDENLVQKKGYKFGYDIGYYLSTNDGLDKELMDDHVMYMVYEVDGNVMLSVRTTASELFNELLHLDYMEDGAKEIGNI